MALVPRRPTTGLQRRFWSLHSRTWDDLLEDPAAAAHITELLDCVRTHCPEPRTVIDLGCGTGNYVLSLAPHSGIVIGVDFAPGMLAKAEQKRQRLGIGNACFIASDLQDDLPLRPGVAELVMSVYSLQFLHAPAVLAEVRRLLVVGGHLLVEVPKSAVIPARAPGATFFSHRAFHVVKRWLALVGTRTRFVRTFSATDIQAAVTDAGFAVVDAREDDRRVALLCQANAP